jgi:hypothetical protein
MAVLATIAMSAQPAKAMEMADHSARYPIVDPVGAMKHAFANCARTTVRGTPTQPAGRVKILQNVEC